MRILLAPNAFKGTFSAVRVAEIWEKALAGRAGIETVARPLSDGGDGALEVWERLLEGASRVWFVARDPLGEPRRVPCLWLAGKAAGFVESALASGLALVPPGARDPLNSTSRGTGQLLLGLLELGAREIAVGLGGSATVDGGLGLAVALGYRFLNRHGREVELPQAMPRLARIVPPASHPWEGVRVRALCDVRNPLVGPSGAAQVFGPQKFRPGDPGLKEGVERLGEGLERMAERMAADLGHDLGWLPGAGAAGGLGAGLAAFAAAELESGSAHFLEAAGIPELLREAGQDRVDGILTGEGSFDDQSGEGKISGELLALGARAGIPLTIVAGKAPAEAGDLVLTGTALEPGREELDADALAALAVLAVDRYRRNAVRSAATPLP